MANPFYPPNRDQNGHESRGSIGGGYDGTDNVPFDPDRRGGSIARMGRPDENGPAHPYNSRDARQEPTEGPGGAATFYPSEYVADKKLGSGTDGFGGGHNLSQENPYPVHEKDYRATFRGNDGMKLEPESGLRKHDHQSAYTQPNATNAAVRDRGQAPFAQHQQNYDPSPQASTYILPPDQRNITPYHYPPSNNFGYSQSTVDLRAPLTHGQQSVDRPDTPGIYRDRAPRMDKLTEEQKQIAKSFPKDLDEDGGSLLKTAITMCKDWRSFMKWKFVPYYVLIVVICVLVALMTIYHKQIVDWLTPISRKVREVSWGWIIPVAILFVISFPPLFGHEVVGVLCGIVYGLWIGFGVLSLGTLLGELGNFYAFKYLLKKHGEKFERRSIDYACMAHIVREGGFMVILMARLSAIPGHFTTAVFATVGMNIFVFTIAAILSLPKQLVVVYLGVAIEQAGGGDESTRSKVIKYVVLIVSFGVTIGVAIWLYGKMHKARPIVQARLRERRYQMLTEAGGGQSEVEGSPDPNAVDDVSSLGHHLKNNNGFDDNAMMLRDSEIEKQEQSKKQGFWSRLSGKNKGKETSERGFSDVNLGHEMSMRQNATKVSFETDSNGHNGGYYTVYEGNTLRPGMSYGDQYMSRVQPYSAGARLPASGIDRDTQQYATTSSPEKNVYRAQLTPHSAPNRYSSAEEHVEEMQSHLYSQDQQNQRLSVQGLPPNSNQDRQYQHVANVDSIYHLPQPSQSSSTGGGNYATAL
ncbi:uncharacterized protein FA14DRAFT_160803 [Meira miltonrushii]|uniref:Golgi apparatus membrane protein TVP38 n=1 Tax=Meira miltonrushii TaxID=1280837 RepID=A0A316VE03_9BASI|nr:uncharacterized protein FA14DRAFT_160803 [Meira miltonrushii]PWN35802.1 hypothetical protein FA14DRAFT_160803 [Meira miltonrushii]